MLHVCHSRLLHALSQVAAAVAVDPFFRSRPLSEKVTLHVQGHRLLSQGDGRERV
jgi:hypothetical protein